MNNWIKNIQIELFSENSLDQASKLPYLTNYCTCCALPLPDDTPTNTLCGQCIRQTPAFDRVLTPFIYAPPIQEMLAAFKHEHALHQGRILGKHLAKHVQQHTQGVDLLLPIPLHRKRLAQRGFNQAAELTLWLSKILDIPWRTNRLYRIQDTPSQRHAKRRERTRNVRKAFQVKGTLPGRVALVDDVVTTGATANAAAQRLRQAGVSYIEIWAVARTPKSS